MACRGGGPGLALLTHKIGVGMWIRGVGMVEIFVRGPPAESRVRLETVVMELMREVCDGKFGAEVGGLKV